MDNIQIVLGGKERNLEFTQRTYSNFYNSIDLDKFHSDFHYEIVYAALETDAYYNRSKIEPFKEVCLWVDKLSIEDKAKILEAYENTQLYKDAKEKGQKMKEAGETLEPPKKKTSKNIMSHA